MKRAFLHLCKAAGLFWLARRFSRERIRVLCYHGFSIEDEGAFRPSMYMPAALFRRRLEYLRCRGFPVLPLAEALSLQEQGRLPDRATVITIDDGWHSTWREALPLLREYAMPVTLYVTSYHLEKATPVFGVLVSYLLWRSTADGADLSTIGVPGLESCTGAVISDPRERQRVEREIVEYGESRSSEGEREELARRLSAALDVDLDAVIESRKFALVDEHEMREMLAAGVDIQLHTHRHRLPLDEEGAAREIEDNRAVLARVTDRPLVHFCYPSGEWSPEHWSGLERLGVRSATTCMPGLVGRESHRLALRRIMDTVAMSDIEFEAVMSGFMDTVKRVLDRRATEGGA